MKLHFRHVAGMFLLSLSTGLLGCAEKKPTADVVGKITFAGNPPNVVGVAISFLPTDGQAVMVGVDPDGSFKGMGIPVGENKLSVRYSSPDDSSSKPRRGPKNDPDRDVQPIKAAAKPAGFTIPEKFKNPLSSGKTFVVEPGKENTLNWDVR